MRETFSRLEDNEVVNIEVYLDAKEHKEDCPWIFSVFIKFDAINDELDSFFETKESLIIALELENRAYYVGNRIVGEWSEVYFYASDTKKLDSIVTEILKPTGYIYESNAARDKDWQFFDFNIFPTDLELCLMQSEHIISLMKEEGDDKSISREVEHYASFDTFTQKERFIKKALTCGFTFKDDISSEELEYGVALTKEHSLNEDELREVIAPLLESIKEEHGEYELWSTILVETQS
ncbi:DUF695 domain-containing protein [Candidatus Sulfurimonas baltica]|uniref:DUF695 domain-containing protein n=1 Tax=Candidatus Sulfurimonas baltica TaxID=2740404 RepID=A0A7S7LWY4_9BACT|nr:DUF695 domain-containing protein [Candidatus Sulfurimonas baltica]QOY53049.1 DUF695 domain-containing protein [Candidatus Sulfurimonas baltica]